MSRIVPADYIPTDQATQELVASDGEYRRLHADWKAAGQKPGNAEWLATSNRAEAIGRWLMDAIQDGALPLLAVRREQGKWCEYAISDEHFRRGHGHSAVWTGVIDRLALPSTESWLADAALCFRRREFGPWKDLALEAMRAASERLWTVAQAVKWIRTQGFHEAQAQLEGACRAGKVVMFGRPGGQGEEIIGIPQVYWDSRAIHDDLARGVVAAKAPEFGGLSEPWWDHLRLRPADVRRVWPSRNETSKTGESQQTTTIAPAPPAAAAPDNELLTWLTSQIAQRRGAGEDCRRGAMVILLRDKFPTVRERDARKLFATIPRGLKGKAGRKKSAP